MYIYTYIYIYIFGRYSRWAGLVGFGFGYIALSICIYMYIYIYICTDCLRSWPEGRFVLDIGDVYNRITAALSKSQVPQEEAWWLSDKAQGRQPHNLTNSARGCSFKLLYIYILCVRGFGHALSFLGLLPSPHGRGVTPAFSPRVSRLYLVENPCRHSGLVVG